MNPKIASSLNRAAVFGILIAIAFLIAIISVVRPLFAISIALCTIAGALAILNPFWVLVAYVLIFPFAPYLAYPAFPTITLPKLVFALAFGGFAIAAILRSQRISIAAEIKVTALLVALAFVSLIWSENRSAGAITAFSLFGMVALMALASAFSQSKPKLEALVRLLLYQSLVFSVFGIIQFITKKTLWNIGYYPDINYFITYRGLVRASSVFLHPNDFSSYLIITIPLAIVWGFERRGRERMVGFLSAVTGLFALALTFTRSAWVALAVAAFLTLFRRYWKMLVGLGLVILLISGIAFVHYQRDAALFLSRLEASPDRSVSDRTWAYEAAWGMIKSSPIIGVGIGQFVIKYPDFKPYEASWTARGERVPMTVHNMMLEIASELGALGLILFFSFLYLVTKKVRRLARSGDLLARTIGISMACGLLAFFIQAQLNNQLYMEIAWIALGLALGAGTVTDDRR